MASDGAGGVAWRTNHCRLLVKFTQFAWIHGTQVNASPSQLSHRWFSQVTHKDWDLWTALSIWLFQWPWDQVMYWVYGVLLSTNWGTNPCVQSHILLWPEMHMASWELGCKFSLQYTVFWLYICQFCANSTFDYIILRSGFSLSNVTSFVLFGAVLKELWAAQGIQT